MKAYILDASAVLAWLWREKGAERVADLLAEGACFMCSVNHAEVAAKVLDKVFPPDQVAVLLASLDIEIHPFTAADALESALLWLPTRHLGLSLGDRACLAQAKSRQAVAVTADRPWTLLDPVLGIEIECIREEAS